MTSQEDILIEKADVSSAEIEAVLALERMDISILDIGTINDLASLFVNNDQNPQLLEFLVADKLRKGNPLPEVNEGINKIAERLCRAIAGLPESNRQTQHGIANLLLQEFQTISAAASNGIPFVPKPIKGGRYGESQDSTAERDGGREKLRVVLSAIETIKNGEAYGDISETEKKEKIATIGRKLLFLNKALRNYKTKLTNGLEVKNLTYSEVLFLLHSSNYHKFLNDVGHEYYVDSHSGKYTLRFYYPNENEKKVAGSDVWNGPFLGSQEAGELLREQVALEQENTKENVSRWTKAWNALRNSPENLRKKETWEGVGSAAKLAGAVSAPFVVNYIPGIGFIQNKRKEIERYGQFQTKEGRRVRGYEWWRLTSQNFEWSNDLQLVEYVSPITGTLTVAEVNLGKESGEVYWARQKILQENGLSYDPRLNGLIEKLTGSSNGKLAKFVLDLISNPQFYQELSQLSGNRFPQLSVLTSSEGEISPTSLNQLLFELKKLSETVTEESSPLGKCMGKKVVKAFQKTEIAEDIDDEKVLDLARQYGEKMKKLNLQTALTAGFSGARSVTMVGSFAMAPAMALDAGLGLANAFYNVGARTKKRVQSEIKSSGEISLSEAIAIGIKETASSAALIGLGFGIQTVATAASGFGLGFRQKSAMEQGEKLSFIETKELTMGARNGIRFLSVGAIALLIAKREQNKLDEDDPRRHESLWQYALSPEITEKARLLITGTSLASSLNVVFRADTRLAQEQLAGLAPKSQPFETMAQVDDRARLKSAATDILNQPSAKATGTCFLAGTLISMADGSYKKIEDVAFGDKVFGYDHLSGKRVAQSVTKTFVHEVKECLVIKIQNSKIKNQKYRSKVKNILNNFDVDSLRVTQEHPIFVGKRHPYANEEGFALAGDLKVGDVVFVDDGGKLVEYRICKIKLKSNSQFSIFNFQSILRIFEFKKYLDFNFSDANSGNVLEYRNDTRDLNNPSAVSLRSTSSSPLIKGEVSRQSRDGGVTTNYLVYNFETEITHTYIANGVSVHNKGNLRMASPVTETVGQSSSVRNDELIRPHEGVLHTQMPGQSDINQEHLVVSGAGSHDILERRQGVPKTSLTFDNSKLNDWVHEAGADERAPIANNVRTVVDFLYDDPAASTLAGSTGPIKLESLNSANADYINDLLNRPHGTLITQTDIGVIATAMKIQGVGSVGGLSLDDTSKPGFSSGVTQAMENRADLINSQGSVYRGWYDSMEFNREVTYRSTTNYEQNINLWQGMLYGDSSRGFQEAAGATRYSATADFISGIQTSQDSVQRQLDNVVSVQTLKGVNVPKLFAIDGTGMDRARIEESFKKGNYGELSNTLALEIARVNGHTNAAGEPIPNPNDVSQASNIAAIMLYPETARVVDDALKTNGAWKFQQTQVDDWNLKAGATNGLNVKELWSGSSYDARSPAVAHLIIETVQNDATPAGLNVEVLKTLSEEQLYAISSLQTDKTNVEFSLRNLTYTDPETGVVHDVGLNEQQVLNVAAIYRNPATADEILTRARNVGGIAADLSAPQPLVDPRFRVESLGEESPVQDYNFTIETGGVVRADGQPLTMIVNDQPLDNGNSNLQHGFLTDSNGNTRVFEIDPTAKNISEVPVFSDSSGKEFMLPPSSSAPSNSTSTPNYFLFDPARGEVEQGYGLLIVDPNNRAGSLELTEQINGTGYWIDRTQPVPQIYVAGNASPVGNALVDSNGYTIGIETARDSDGDGFWDALGPTTEGKFEVQGEVANIGGKNFAVLGNTLYVFDNAQMRWSVVNGSHDGIVFNEDVNNNAYIYDSSASNGGKVVDTFMALSGGFQKDPNIKVIVPMNDTDASLLVPNAKIDGVDLYIDKTRGSNSDDLYTITGDQATKWGQQVAIGEKFYEVQTEGNNLVVVEFGIPNSAESSAVVKTDMGTFFSPDGTSMYGLNGTQTNIGITEVGGAKYFSPDGTTVYDLAGNKQEGWSVVDGTITAPEVAPPAPTEPVEATAQAQPTSQPTVEPTSTREPTATPQQPIAPEPTVPAGEMIPHSGTINGQSATFDLEGGNYVEHTVGGDGVKAVYSPDAFDTATGVLKPSVSPIEIIDAKGSILLPLSADSDIYVDRDHAVEGSTTEFYRFDSSNSEFVANENSLLVINPVGIPFAEDVKMTNASGNTVTYGGKEVWVDQDSNNLYVSGQGSPIGIRYAVNDQEGKFVVDMYEQETGDRTLYEISDDGSIYTVAPHPPQQLDSRTLYVFGGEVYDLETDKLTLVQQADITDGATNFYFDTNLNTQWGKLYAANNNQLLVAGSNIIMYPGQEDRFLAAKVGNFNIGNHEDENVIYRRVAGGDVTELYSISSGEVEPWGKQVDIDSSTHYLVRISPDSEDKVFLYPNSEPLPNAKVVKGGDEFYFTPDGQTVYSVSGGPAVTDNNIINAVKQGTNIAATPAPTIVPTEVEPTAVPTEPLNPGEGGDGAPVGSPTVEPTQGAQTTALPTNEPTLTPRPTNIPEETQAPRPTLVDATATTQVLGQETNLAPTATTKPAQAEIIGNETTAGWQGQSMPKLPQGAQEYRFGTGVVPDSVYTYQLNANSDGEGTVDVVFANNNGVNGVMSKDGRIFYPFQNQEVDLSGFNASAINANIIDETNMTVMMDGRTFPNVESIYPYDDGSMMITSKAENPWSVTVMSNQRIGNVNKIYFDDNGEVGKLYLQHSNESLNFGKVSASNVEAINFGSDGKISIYPNDVAGSPAQLRFQGESITLSGSSEISLRPDRSLDHITCIGDAGCKIAVGAHEVIDLTKDESVAISKTGREILSFRKNDGETIDVLAVGNRSSNAGLEQFQLASLSRPERMEEVDLFIDRRTNIIYEFDGHDYKPVGIRFPYDKSSYRFFTAAVDDRGVLIKDGVKLNTDTENYSIEDWGGHHVINLQDGSSGLVIGDNGKLTDTIIKNPHDGNSFFVYDGVDIIVGKDQNSFQVQLKVNGEDTTMSFFYAGRTDGRIFRIGSNGNLYEFAQAVAIKPAADGGASDLIFKAGKQYVDMATFGTYERISNPNLKGHFYVNDNGEFFDESLTRIDAIGKSDSAGNYAYLFYADAVFKVNLKNNIFEQINTDPTTLTAEGIEIAPSGDLSLRDGVQELDLASAINPKPFDMEEYLAAEKRGALFLDAGDAPLLGGLAAAGAIAASKLAVTKRGRKAVRNVVGGGAKGAKATAGGVKDVGAKVGGMGIKGGTRLGKVGVKGVEKSAGAIAKVGEGGIRKGFDIGSNVVKGAFKASQGGAGRLFKRKEKSGVVPPTPNIIQPPLVNPQDEDLFGDLGDFDDDRWLDGDNDLNVSGTIPEGSGPNDFDADSWLDESIKGQQDF